MTGRPNPVAERLRAALPSWRTASARWDEVALLGDLAANEIDRLERLCAQYRQDLRDEQREAQRAAQDAAAEARWQADPDTRGGYY
ncbi:MAG: hypothetical protein IT325_09970 [Anaerolineae bacterium]|nr:hypothetical protein [Anaerolineae bacterium]